MTAAGSPMVLRRRRHGEAEALAPYPKMTVEMLPKPPQCRVALPRRAAGRPSINTRGSPSMMMNVLGPQQAACTPTSPTRAAGLPWIKTRGLPEIIGPTVG